MATGLETANGPVTRRNRTDAAATNTTPDRRRKSPPRKYRHVAAVHSQARPSCLSHDAQTSPSFVGFRNLMVIVLGT